jgi:hypothetical protein
LRVLFRLGLSSLPRERGQLGLPLLDLNCRLPLFVSKVLQGIHGAINDKRPPVLSRKFTETERVREQGNTPRVSDTLVNVTVAPDADYHPEALANAVADNEAGTMPEDEFTSLRSKGKS